MDFRVHRLYTGRIGSNAYVVENGGRAAVVDAGMGRAVLDFAEKNDLKIELCLLTHGHFDHIGACAALLLFLFPALLLSSGTVRSGSALRCADLHHMPHTEQAVPPGLPVQILLLSVRCSYSCFITPNLSNGQIRIQARPRSSSRWSTPTLDTRLS